MQSKGRFSKSKMAGDGQMSDSDDEMRNLNGEVNVPLAKFLSLRHDAKKNNSVPPRQYVVESTEIGGKSNHEQRRVELSITFVVKTFGKEDEWITVPLLPVASVVVNKAEIAEKVKGYVAPDSSGSIQLHCYGGDSKYTVKIDAHLPFTGLQLESFTLSPLPLSVLNKLSFTIGKGDLDVKLDPAVGTIETKEEADATGAKSTLVMCNYPATTTVTLQWREKVIEAKIDAEEETRAKKQTIVTAVQNILHSIGEGVVRSRAAYDITVTHGARTMLEFDIHSMERKELRVLNVAGRAIKRWQVTDVDADRASSSAARQPLVAGGDDDSLPPYAQGPTADEVVISMDSMDTEMTHITQNGKPVQSLRQKLTVWFEYGIEGDYKLVISSELEMTSNSSPVNLPCFSARKVDRETGHAAVEARTNVEINEIRKHGAARIDVGEVPTSISSAAENPILYAYKYLETPYGITLDVTKHDDAMSLVAIIEECWLQATQSEDSLLHRIVLRIRNSQKQFVRIQIPDSDHDIWSSVVGGQPVKAAIDQKTGEVMIPLQKSSGSEKKPAPFLVELVYMTKSIEMKGERGTLSIGFAKFDIPVQQLYSVVYLPDGYRYGEFTGDLKETKRPIKPVPSTDNKDSWGHAPPAPVSQLHRMDSADHMRMQSNMMMDSMSDGSDEECEEVSFVVKSDRRNRNRAPMKLAEFKSKDRGHVPVKIAKLEVGTKFSFEKLLVQSTHLRVSVEYKEEKKEKQRTLDDKSSCAIM